MVGQDFKVGDLVWAQMKNYPPWPSKIAEPPVNAKVKSKKAQHWVYFFGSKNYAWIPDDRIFPHGEEMLQKAFKNKSAPFQRAVEEIISESKVLVKQIIQEKNETNSNEIPINMQNKNKALKIKKFKYKKRALFEKSKFKKKALVEKSGLKKKALIEESKKNDVTKHIVETNRIENDSGSSPVLSPKSKLQFEFSVVTSKIKEVPLPKNKRNKKTPKHPSGALKNRKYISRPSTPPLDINIVKESVKAKHVKPTSKKIGFLGLGAIGRGIVMNLLISGHDVTVWNRTPQKCDVFVEAGAHRGQTPADVIQACDITFCCVSEPMATKTLIFGNCGVLKGLEGCTPWEKGYVELTGIDPQTSQEIAKEIFNRGGRYLEAPIHGSRSLAESGSLLALAAGDPDLFHACESCFFAISEHAYFISLDVGNASRMSIILSMFNGTVTAALAEALCMVHRCKMNIHNFLEILAAGPANCPIVKERGRAMKEETFATNIAIKHQQRVFGQAIALGDSVNQPLRVSAAAHEIFKHAKMLSYSDHDISAVIQGTRY